MAEIMKVLLLFSSKHGHTARVVRVASQTIVPSPDVIDVQDEPPQGVLVDYDVLLFFTPTYGDEELHEPMEAFIRRVSADLSRQRFAICELGNYGGYDDFGFGALRILQRRLLELNARELGTHLSLDSLPQLSHEQLHRWLQHLNRVLET